MGVMGAATKKPKTENKASGLGSTLNKTFKTAVKLIPNIFAKSLYQWLEKGVFHTQ